MRADGYSKGAPPETGWYEVLWDQTTDWLTASIVYIRVPPDGEYVWGFAPDDDPEVIQDLESLTWRFAEESLAQDAARFWKLCYHSAAEQEVS